MPSEKTLVELVEALEQALKELEQNELLQALTSKKEDLTKLNELAESHGGTWR